MKVRAAVSEKVMRVLGLGLALGVLIAVAGCGAQTPQPPGSIKVIMTEYAYSPKDITVPAGKSVFYLVNSGSNAHTMILRDSTGVRLAGSDLVSAGDVSIFTADNLQVGNYVIFCDQQGHEASGMVGTLTVIAAAPSPSPEATPSATAAASGAPASASPSTSP
jgi:plastocyanin